MHSRDGRAAATATITVHCRFFARYADALGRDEMALEMPDGATVADAVGRLRDTLPKADLLPERPLAAVNREHAAPDTPLADGDEMALLPPLAGG
jgi:molybdopterin converting factor small subunit